MSAAPHIEPREEKRDVSPAELRRRFSDAFAPRANVYWADMLGSAAIGWIAFWLAPRLSTPAEIIAFGVATLGFYRAVLFIHELAHLRAGAVPGFEAIWNLLVGIPLMVPSLMYVGSHAAHHRRSTYGTADDPEYAPIARWTRGQILRSTAVMAVVPVLLAIRWSLLGPLSWLVPPLRRFTVSACSTLVINPAYQRPAPQGRSALLRWWGGELGATLFSWSVIGAVAAGALDPQWLLRWYGVAAALLMLNHLRTLAAHRYESSGEKLDTMGQLVDSVNLRGIPGLTPLLAPVGLRYHGLHHLVPGLPYHSLGALHRRLLAELPPDSAYRRTERSTLVATLGTLLSRARRRDVSAQLRSFR
jgi:fatty acid desaturase